MPATPIIHADARTLQEEARKLRLKKRFGQNFLIDPKVPAAIADSLQLSTSETVLEIGPGAGALTEHLLSRAGHVIGVELERDMIAHLQRKFAPDRHPNGSKLTLVASDILRFDPSEMLASGQLKQPFAVVGNIPYNITTPILFYLCGEVYQNSHPWRQWVRHITLMIQQEVAERIVAKPNCKAYNHLSIAIQTWFEARIILTVSRHAFSPPPKVTSSVIQLIPREKPLVEITNGDHFAKLIKAAFGQRRKTLKNALLGAEFISPHLFATMISNANENLAAQEKTDQPLFTIEATARAEQLPIHAFAALANAYSALTNSDA